MRKIVLLLFIISVIPVSLYAADSLKFGTVDLQKALDESETGKKAKSDLETLRASKQSIIDEKGKVIDKLKGDIEKQASVLSAEARKNKEEELEKLVREYQRIIQDSQAELKKKEAELTNTIIREIVEIIDKIGAEEGYTIIIEKGTVPYSNKSIDITDTVVKKYDESKTIQKKS
jgi:outer membrane protein